jgi:hypothetical protein
VASVIKYWAIQMASLGDLMGGKGAVEGKKMGEIDEK